MEEEGQAVGGPGAMAGGFLQEPGLGWTVDRVVDEVVGLQAGAGKGRGVGAFESDGGGVDDEVDVVGFRGKFG